MKPFYDLPINKSAVAVMSKGPSASEVDWKDVRKYCYIIAINEACYAPVDARIFCDKGDMSSGAFIDIKDVLPPKGNELWIGRAGSLTLENCHLIDYLVDDSLDWIKGNFTLTTLFYYLDRFFHDKPVAVFGHDMTDTTVDYYHENGVLVERRHDITQSAKLMAELMLWMDTSYKVTQNIYNLSPVSKWDHNRITWEQFKRLV